MDTILFDIDGTLLDTNKSKFIEALFNSASECLSEFYNSSIVKKALHAGMLAMKHDESSDVNRLVFINAIEEYIDNGQLFIDRLDGVLCKSVFLLRFFS